MGIKLQGFQGEQRKINESLLPINGSSVANNIDLTHGTLLPFSGMLTYLSAPFGGPPYPDIKTLYGTASEKAIGSLTDTYVARQITQDTGKEWVYWTGGSAPSMVSMSDVSTAMGSATSSTNLYGLAITLGISAPTAAITGLTVSGSGSGIPLTKAYVYTWVGSNGEESAPSPVSGQVQSAWGQSVSFTVPTPSGLSSYITAWRYYRTDIAGNWRFVEEVPIASLTRTDGTDELSLGEVLATEGWYPPPSNLTGLKNGPNGQLCGFFGNTVAFCAPYAPYAWPVTFQFNVDYPVVAVAPNSGGWFVATEGLPYFIYGTNPSQMSMSRIDQIQPCVAPRSMVDMGDYLIYASPDGLVAASGMTVRLMTKEIITPAQFRSLSPSGLRACYWQGKYLAFFADGTTNAFIYYPDSNSFVTLDLSATATVQWIGADDVYVYDYVSGNIERIGGGSAMTMSWKSKRFRGGLANMGAARVDAASYPVTFNLYADDNSTAIFSYSVPSEKVFRLPAGYYANSFYVEIVGTNEVKAVYIGQDIDDATEAA